MKIFNYNKPLQDKSLVGSIAMVARTPRSFGERHKYVYIGDKSLSCFGYKACITQKVTGGFGFGLPLFVSLSAEDIDALRDGDIVKFDGNSLTVLWEHEGRDNAFMLTEACNCKCIMCPQPPKAHESQLVADAHAILDLLKGVHAPSICITGGEPTLVKDDFVAILQRCVQEHPEAEIAILTNGKTFANIDFAKKVVAVANTKTMFCVSLHSDIDYINDEIVGVKSSRDATENGIYNLAQCGACIEIRHVITKKNFMRLPQFAEYIYSYFPFCFHYAFMGMEVHGDAEKNQDTIYIAPHEYKEELREAIISLYHRGLPISVYNIPLCMCHENIHKFAMQSISQWKNMFHENCGGCEAKEVCAGFFATSASVPIEHIKPLPCKTG